MQLLYNTIEEEHRGTVIEEVCPTSVVSCLLPPNWSYLMLCYVILSYLILSSIYEWLSLYGYILYTSSSRSPEEIIEAKEENIG